MFNKEDKEDKEDKLKMPAWLNWQSSSLVRNIALHRRDSMSNAANSGKPKFIYR